jgi:hypothetical protein
MGILDDAIREHLELKRAHGASEDELRAKEVEAFGPQRQEVAPEAPPAAADAEPAVEAPASEAAATEPEPDAPAPDPSDPYAVHPGDDPIPDPHDHTRRGADPAWGDDAELFAERPARSTDERHPALHDTDEHFHGSSDAPEPVFGHRQAEQAAGGPEAPVSPQAPVDEAPGDADDVLEETPEFLQDAPEHDRLWFEQKPPRDFDFGE